MLSRNEEDYLEAILNISERNGGFAKTGDIAGQINVKPSSVTQMLAKLCRKGYVKYKKYSGTALNKKGKKKAEEIRKRHFTFMKLLKYLKVSEKNAKKDACIMEHHLSRETIRQISSFVMLIDSFGETPNFLKNFERFCRTKELPECEKLKRNYEKTGRIE